MLFRSCLPGWRWLALALSAAAACGLGACASTSSAPTETRVVDGPADQQPDKARLAKLKSKPGFRFLRVDLGDRTGVEKIWRENRPEVVVHLAAQAGVRYSLTHPHTYAKSNLEGMLDVLEACRAEKTGHLIFASSKIGRAHV